MKTNEDSPRSLDDLIFENRNHDYGAYVIRRTYPENVNKGALLAVGVAVIVTIISVLPKEMVPVLPVTPDDGGLVFQSPPLLAHPLPPSHPVQAQKGTPNLAPKPTTADIQDNPVVPNDEVVFGPENGADVGDPNAISVNVSQVIPDEIGLSFPVEDKIWDRTEVMPEYVGGLNAMVHFISRNVKYPPKARRLGIEGTVFVSFVIGKDGSVLDPKIVKGFDVDCENEAIKVMTKMARWNPGLQGGMPVMVRMVIPIKFALAQ